MMLTNDIINILVLNFKKKKKRWKCILDNFFPFGREKGQQHPKTSGKVSLTGKNFYRWIRDLGLFTLKTDWCLGLMIKSYH